MTYRTLPRNAYTLSPADRDTREAADLYFDQWDQDRFIIRFVEVRGNTILETRPVLTDEWTYHATDNGVVVAVRRADCGGGCRCAGEFRITG